MPCSWPRGCAACKRYNGPRTIDHWYVAKDGSVVVVLRDEHFEELVENRYGTEYVVKWDPMNPDTRPWKYSCELEKRL